LRAFVQETVETESLSDRPLAAGKTWLATGATVAPGTRERSSGRKITGFSKGLAKG